MSQRPALPVLGPAGPFVDGAPHRRRRISRDADRRVTLGGIVVAAAFVASAALSVIAGAVGVGEAAPWLPLHLALAGGAGVAIGAVLPFFTAALAVAPPIDPRPRVVVIVLLAGGAAAVAAGVQAGTATLAVVGGQLYVAGLVGVATVAFTPVRTGLRSGWSHLVAAYAAALVLLGLGVGLATGYVAGIPAVIDAWVALKPAHVWLNVFGFVSLTIAATLVHLGPTIAGARIRPRRSADVALVGLAAGPALVALGFACDHDAVARLGGAIELLGASALAAFMLVVRHDAGPWTTDLDWHRFTLGSIGVGVGWFVVAASIAGGRVAVLGATAAAWSLELVAGPLVLGWVVQVLVGAWTHLLPAIAPGTPAGHAAARRLLAALAIPRLVAWNLGVTILAVGLPLRLEAAVTIGGGLVLLGVVAATGLLMAVLVRMRSGST
jgi:nitrite reductase (NO-forming)